MNKKDTFDFETEQAQRLFESGQITFKQMNEMIQNVLGDLEN